VGPLSWTNETTEQGVTERTFQLAVDAEIVPGVAWSPAGKERWPTILLGHGGTQHKRTPGVLSLGRRLVRHLGYGAVAIDAPDHGERRTEPQDSVAPDEMRRRMSVITLETTPGFAGGPFGYWGVSMGTAIGLPFVASDPRISAAVFGLAGIGNRPGAERLAEQARSLKIPVLFLFQWDDELMEREHGMAFFDAIGSAEKTMHVNPGGHIQMPMHERDAVEAFYSRHIREDA